MSNRLKIVGVAALATLAMAVQTSSASAVVANFASEKYNATLTGNQTAAHTLETVAGPLKCTTAKATVTITEKTTELFSTPSFAGCTFVAQTAFVLVNGCKFRFEAGAMEGENEAKNGGLEIWCEAGKSLSVTANECIMKILPTGVGIGSIDYKNVAGGAFEATANLSPIKYWLNNKCGKAEGNYENGVYNGIWKFTGNNGPVGVAP